jgi:excisionase family DNA binding protein
MAATAAQLGAGLAMGQQMVAAMGTPQTTPAAGGPPPLPGAAVGAGALPEMLSPGDVANLLKVSEGDVLATLTEGTLKGKKIGSTWRVTRQALEEFLKH